MTDLVSATPNRLEFGDTPTLQEALAQGLKLLTYSLSEKSKRIYHHTYTQWFEFCRNHDLPPTALFASHVIDYLEMLDLAHSTKLARLSHLRRLVKAIRAHLPDDPTLRSMDNQLSLLRIRRSESEKATPTTKHVLKRKQIYDLFAVYGDDSIMHRRNRALLAILFYTGMRESEAAALHWPDIDLESMLVTVRHGKGDKARIIPVLGAETSYRYLSEWQAVTAGRTVVFCRVRRGDKLGKDAPITSDGIYKLVRDTGDKIGIDRLSAHDARRTLITTALQNGTAIPDVQAQAGHSKPSTTLGYAQAGTAEEIRRRMKLGY